MPRNSPICSLVIGGLAVVAACDHDERTSRREPTAAPVASPATSSPVAGQAKVPAPVPEARAPTQPAWVPDCDKVVKRAPPPPPPSREEEAPRFADSLFSEAEPEPKTVHRRSPSADLNQQVQDSDPRPKPKDVEIQPLSGVPDEITDLALTKMYCVYRTGLRACGREARFIGSTEIAFKIGDNGRIDRASVKVSNRDLKTCLEDRMATWRFRPGNDLDVALRVRYTP